MPVGFIYLIKTQKTMSEDGTVRLRASELNDFIGPSLACIKPVKEIKPKKSSKKKVQFCMCAHLVLHTFFQKGEYRKAHDILFLLLTFTWCTYLLTLARGTFLPFNQTSSWRVRYRLSKMEVTLKSQRMEAPLNCRKQPSHYQTVSPAGRCTATCNPFPRLKYSPEYTGLLPELAHGLSALQSVISFCILLISKSIF